jgi:enamine deaminase RidA (YjgF/YER057c/UK114 family)
MSHSIEHRLTELGITLPALVPPRGHFAPYVKQGKLIYLSGKGAPLREHGAPVPKVGAEVTVAQAREHAREVALYLLAVMREALGGFDHLRQVVKVFGMVNATPDFTQHTEVIDGASELLVQVLGERGVHARSAIGVGSLPRGFAVEIEAVIEQV